MSVVNPGRTPMTRTYLYLVLAAVLLITAGCKKKDEQPRARLVSEEELRGLDLDIKKITERNRAKKCPRPVLRGQPLPGTASADILGSTIPDSRVSTVLDSNIGE